VFTVSNLPLSAFSSENSGQSGVGSQDIFFLIYNTFNDLIVKMRQSSAYYVEQLIERSKDKNEGSMITLILSTLFLALMFAVLVPVSKSVNED
jgi:hypothetical protein